MDLLKALGKTVVVTFKRLYDILATYLLFWILYTVAVALGIHFGLPHLWDYLGVMNPDLVWGEMAARVGLDVATTRLLVFALIHALVFVIVRRPISWVQPYVEGAFDKTAHFFDRVTSEKFSLRLFGEVVFSMIVTALLVPFVWQPTLVRGNDLNAWAERGANLIDGSAVIDLPDSVVAYYRSFTAEPVVAEDGLDAAELDELFAEYEAYEQAEKDLHEKGDTPPVEPGHDITGTPYVDENVTLEEPRDVTGPPRSGQPAMDRWNDHIWEAVDEDPALFASVKAFMYVESAGRQYAVSRTGCLGLMQFCSGTAKSHPYRQVFGTGQVYACGCQRTSCDVPRDVARKLESGQMSMVEDQEDNFPCELTDARFDPDKAIPAGTLYVKRLHERYDGNIYLMYVGYNSGPAVADKVYEEGGRDPNMGLDEIEQHLTDALTPYQGSKSARRARGLVGIHLPKIKRAQQRYAKQAVSSSVEVTQADVDSEGLCVAQVEQCVVNGTCVPNRPERPVVRVVY